MKKCIHRGLKGGKLIFRWKKKVPRKKLVGEDKIQSNRPLEKGKPHEVSDVVFIHEHNGIRVSLEIKIPSGDGSQI